MPDTPRQAKGAAQWPEFERIVREALAGTPADEQAIAAIVERMRAFFELCNRDFSTTITYTLPSSTTADQQSELDGSLRSAMSAFETKLHQLTSELFFDRMLVEIQLYYARNSIQEALTATRVLTDALAASDIDSDGAIRRCIENAGEAWARKHPDYNASITNVRIALETIARRAAPLHARSVAGASWGSSLLALRENGILNRDEEQLLGQFYTFLSPGAHVPAGSTEEERARLARKIGLAACQYLLKKLSAATARQAMA